MPVGFAVRPRRCRDFPAWQYRPQIGSGHRGFEQMPSAETIVDPTTVQLCQRAAQKAAQPGEIDGEPGHRSEALLCQPIKPSPQVRVSAT